MNVSNNGINLIKEFEGLRLKAYLDAVGIPTIGYGHTKGVKMGQVITEPEAERLLREDLVSFERDVNKLARVPLTQNQYDALISLVFNIGPTNFSKSTLLKKLNAGDYDGAANEFTKWVYAGGKVLPGLERRRAAEKRLFLK